MNSQRRPSLEDRRYWWGITVIYALGVVAWWTPWWREDQGGSVILTVMIVLAWWLLLWPRRPWRVRFPRGRLPEDESSRPGTR